MNIDTRSQLEKYQKNSYDLIRRTRDLVDSIHNNNNNDNDNGASNLMDLMMKLKQESLNIDSTLSQQDEVLDQQKSRNDALQEKCQSLVYQKEVLKQEIEHLQQSFSFDLNNPSLNLPIYLSSDQNQQDNSHQIIESLEKEMTLRISKLNELEEWKQSCKKAKEELNKRQKELDSFESKLKSNHITLQQIIKPLQPNISVQPLPSLQQQHDHQLLVLAPPPLYNLYHEIQVFKDLFYNRLTIDIQCKTDIDVLRNQLYRGAGGSTGTAATTNQPFPISIALSIPSTKNQSTLLLEFYYYPIMKLVTVNPSLDGNEQAGQQILEPLAKDKGLYHNYFESETDLNVNKQQLIGKPFIWAQYITGLSFLPDLAVEDISNKDYHLQDFKPKTSNEILTEIITSF
ncbi:hypothetical protein DFA_12153 [Cavenderia fasciculata]|uniref:Uncharacterized protein n=1 Tax=Cavenderia fasciculata TaxID=261658 RepID=F4QCA0_CACFS|nr:uncharacterized protein DFA_12153 [Cavenderia fasciculata]EGG14381.1 hypothetical protein DFA_12153 [Cavenderia fasciculata]|eukprot:XP_004353790.1 hypothetical protein DFA_12153 [Cavenderia fasciculata]